MVLHSLARAAFRAVSLILVSGFLQTLAQSPADRILHLPFDGDPFDRGGRFDAVPAGMVTLSDGRFGTALRFNGSDAQLAVPDAPEFSPLSRTDGELTVSAWIFLDRLPDSESTPGQGRQIVAKGSPGAFEYGLSTGTNGAIRFELRQPNGTTVATAAGGTISTGSWHHVVGTARNRAFVRVYLDGTLIAESTAFTGTLSDTGSALFVGRNGEGHFLNGRIDEVQVWNRALIPGEFASLSGSGNPATGNGQPRTIGEITVPGEQDDYTFRVNSTEPWYFDALSDGDAVRWSMSGPRGQVIAERDFPGSNADFNDAGSVRPYLTPGEYRITVSGNQAQTGAYGFHLFPFGAATAMTPGAVVRGAMDTARRTHAYQFSGTTGDRIQFEPVQSANIGVLTVRIYRPDGGLLMQNNFRPSGEISLPQSGTYTVLLEGRTQNLDALGIYRFNIAPKGHTEPAPFEGIPVVLGQIITNRHAAGEVERYTFSVTTNELVLYDLLSSNSDGGQLALNLSGRQGAILDHSLVGDSFNGFGLRSLYPGDYQISVRGSEARSYSFRFLRLSEAEHLELDTPVTITLTNNRMTRIFRVAGSPNRRFFFQSHEQTGIENLRYRLVDPFGSLLSEWNLNDHREPFELPLPGTYHLLLEGYSGNNGGEGKVGFQLGNVVDGSQTAGLHSVITGMLEQPGQVQRYRITLPSPVFFYFDSLTNRNDILWTLDGPNGRVFNPTPFSRSDSHNGSSRARLATGEYVLTVDGTGDTIGGFAFRLLDLDTAATDIALNEVVSRRMDRSNETDAYHFSTTAGTKLFFDFVSVSSAISNARWRLLDPFGNVAFVDAGFQGSDLGPFTMSLGGRYTLILEGWIGEQPGSGTYSFAIRTVVDREVPLAIHEVVTGAIESPGQVRRHRFTLPEATFLYFDSLTNRGDLRWTLDGPAGRVIQPTAFSATDSHNGSARVHVTAGEYVFTVSGNGDSVGGYAFRILNLGTIAEDISLNQPVSAHFERSSETDVYRFTASAGTRVFFDFLSGSPATSNARWRLLDPFGGVVHINTGFQNSDLGPFDLAIGGTYLLLIEGWVGEAPGSGTYAFQIHTVVDGEQTLAVNAVTTGSIAKPGQVQRYRFALAEPAFLYIDSLTNRNDVRLTLNGPTGRILGPTRFNGTDSHGGSARARVPAGEYVLTVDGNEDAVGAYAFRLLDLQSVATSITPGQVVNAILDRSNETDVYRFNVIPGDRMFFNFLSGSPATANARWRLLDPFGGVVFVDAGFQGSDLGPFTINTGGEYLLLIEGWVNETAGPGPYSFLVEKQGNTPPPAPDGLPMALDEIQRGTITNLADVARYRFSLAESTTVYFDSLTANDAIRLTLTGPGGVYFSDRGFFSAADRFAADPFRTLPAGDFQVTVRSTEASRSFAFRLLNSRTSTRATIDQDIVATNTPAAGSRFFGFSGVAGTRMYFDGQGTSGFDAAEPVWRLWSPTFGLVGQSNLRSDLDVFSLPINGDYLIEVAGDPRSSSESGQYRFRLVNVIHEMQPMALNTLIQGSIEHPGQLQQFTFTLTEPAVVYLDSLTPDDELRFTLTGPAGTYFADRGFFSSDRFASDPFRSLPAGDYHLGVDGSGPRIGPFRFQLLTASNSTPMALDTTVSATHSPSAISRFFSFHGEAGQRLYFDGINPSGFTAGQVVWRLWSPSFGLVAGQNIQSDLDVFTLPSSGPYLVEVAPDPRETAASGAYQFRLLTVTNSSETLPLNTMVDGTIATPGQLKEYTFTLTEPKTVYFDSMTRNDEVTFTLVGPAGTYFSQRGFFSGSDFFASDPFRTLTAGEHRLIIDGQGIFTGGYRFRLLTTDAARSVNREDLITSTNIPGNGTVLIRFEAGAGETITLDRRSETGPVRSRLWNPVFGLLADVRGNQDAIRVGLAIPGTHVLELTTDPRETAASIQSTFVIVPNPPVTPTAIDGTAGGPDLVVANFPTPTGSLRTGGDLTFRWNVRNDGTASVESSFNDRLVVRTPDGTVLANRLVPHDRSIDGPLAAGATRERSLVVRLPNVPAAAGSLTAIVTLDALASVPERNPTDNAEANNAASTRFDVVLGPFPDLAVHSLNAPALLDAGSTIGLTYVITNRGTAIADGPWQEQIFLRPEGTSGSDVFLAESAFQTSLASGSSIIRTQAITLPLNSDVQAFRLLARVDSGNSVVELNEDNNLAIAASATSVPLRLSLVSSANTIAEASANPRVTLFVSRNGPRSSALTVTLASSDASELTLPATATIPAGADRVQVDAQVQADTLFDGPQTVTLRATAAGFSEGTTTVTVLDSNQPRLLLSVSTTNLVEGSEAALTLRREHVTPLPLSVALSGGGGQLAFPGTVVIPAGQASVTIPITAIPDTALERNVIVEVSASASGFLPGTTAVGIRDDDVPNVTVILSNRTVSEGAGPNATTGTVFRDNVGTRPVAISLRSQHPNSARVPSQVTIPAGQTNISFTVSAVDNQELDGSRTVVISAIVLETGTGFPLREGAPDVLTLTDDDGPALRARVSRDFVGEGLNPAAVLTVTRNTGTNGTLSVSLISSDTTEATLPATALIPNGANSVDVPIRTITDGLPDGNQPVSFTARANGFPDASAGLIVSDVELPDLVVATVEGPTNSVTGAQIDVGWRVENRGFASSGGSLIQRVYFSTDAAAGDDILAGQLEFPGTLPVGSFFGQTLRVRAPAAAGRYWLVVETDAARNVGEGREDNNVLVSADPIRIEKAVSVTIGASPRSAPAGTTVRLSGRATRTLGGGGAPFERVNIFLTLRETVRILAAITDAQGNYSLDFTPLPGEAGQYAVGADYAAATTTPVQDQFVLSGFRIAPVPPQTVTEGGSPVEVAAELRNLSDVPLTGLAATVLRGPTNVTIQASLASANLAADGSLPLSLRINAPQEIFDGGLAVVRVASAEGPTADLEIPIRIEARRSRLVATPSPLDAGMRRGSQASVEFGVTNLGGLPTGPLTVLAPPLPWLSVSAGTQLPSLAPGEGATVSLVLTPPADLPLGLHSGSLAINGTNAGISLPFSFRSFSENRGGLDITTVDELTFYAEGSPRLTNTTIHLIDAVSGRPVLTTHSPNGRLVLPDLIESYYKIRIEAENHTAYENTVLVEAAKTNAISAFLSRQLVRYTWTVTPIEIEDRYQITVETTFETFVPLPVLTVEPSVIDLHEFPGETMQVDLKITNEGLIAAPNVGLDFDQHPRLEISPLIKTVGLLPAKSSITVPVTLRKRGAAIRPNGFARPAADGGGSEPCIIGGKVQFDIPCGGVNVTHVLPLRTINLGSLGIQCGTSAQALAGSCGVCQGGGFIPPGGGLGSPGYTAPIALSPGGSSCDPCVNKKLFELLKCSLEFIPIKVLEKEDNGEPCSNGFGPVTTFVDCMSDAADQLNKTIGKLCKGCPGGDLGKAALPEQAAKLCEKIEKAQKDNPACSGLKFVTKWIKRLKCIATLVEICEGGAGPSGGPFITRSSARTAAGGDPEKDPLTGALHRRARQMQAVVDRYTLIFNEEAWFDLSTEEEFEAFVNRFLPFTTAASAAAGKLAPSEVDSLRSVKPSAIDAGTFDRFIARWNRSVDNYQSGIRRKSDVPAGQSLDFVSFEDLSTGIAREQQALAEIELEGYISVADAFDETLQETVTFLSGGGGGGGAGGVCARVKLRLEQEAIISRDAFNAKLEIDNATGTPLEEISVELKVARGDRSDSTDLFQIRPPVLNGLSGVEGAGIIPARSTGSASWIIVPTGLAAPTNAIEHFVSGTLRYKQDGVLLTVPLAPTRITVLPAPNLVVQYFHQRDVFSDDPFTPEVEPAEPFSLAVLVRNQGFGTAKNFRILSAQPKIVENEKGLLIDFEIVGTEVAGRGLSPTLHAEFGDIAPFSTVVGQWLFKSSLQGLFTEYNATFEHISGLGDKRVSLIDRVEIHEMIRLVEADRQFADGRPDFLVNDVPDLQDLPDTLWFSNGSNAPVRARREATAEPVTSARLTTVLKAETQPGWRYLRVADPAGGRFELREVRRSDGSQVLIGRNAWWTDRTFVGFAQRPLRENLLHILDFDSDGQYTLVYTAGPDIPVDSQPPVSRVNALPAQSGTEISVVWSGSDEGGSGLAFFDIFVAVNDRPATNWVSRSRGAGALFSAEPGNRYAFFSRATDAAGNQEPPPASPDTTTTSVLLNRPPTLSYTGATTVDEGTTLELRALASDPDPGQSLQFELLPGSPAGVSLDPTTGDLSFPTGEGTGPLSDVLRVRVTDNGTPQASVITSINFTVREVNQPPRLASIDDAVIRELSLLTFRARATDDDRPTNEIRFSLAPGAPSGTSIHPVSGVFVWTPDSRQGPSTNRITVVATDNGTPSANASQTVIVRVRDSRPDLTLSLGQTHLFSGNPGRVGLDLDTTLEVESIEFDLHHPGDNLAGLRLTSLATPVSSASLVPVSAGLSHIRLGLDPAAGSLRTRLGNLDFTTDAAAPSAVVPLRIRELEALLASGQSVERTDARNGRVYVVNIDPLLRLEHDAEIGEPLLTLFGRPGRRFTLEATPVLTPPISWKPVTNGVLTAPIQVIPFVPDSETIFLRAVDKP